jgi:rhodanese-related sulfurtransferase
MFGHTPVPSVSAADVAAGAYVIDVREPYEWQAGHMTQGPDGVAELVHMPMGEVQQRLAEIPVEREVVVVCKVGGRSAQVVGYLNQVGRNAVNLDGGMHAWAAAGRPMVSESGGPASVA